MIIDLNISIQHTIRDGQFWFNKKWTWWWREDIGIRTSCRYRACCQSFAGPSSRGCLQHRTLQQGNRPEQTSPQTRRCHLANDGKPTSQYEIVLGLGMVSAGFHSLALKTRRRPQNRKYIRYIVVRTDPSHDHR